MEIANDVDSLLSAKLHSEVFQFVFLYFAADGLWKFIDEKHVFSERFHMVVKNEVLGIIPC